MQQPQLQQQPRGGGRVRQSGRGAGRTGTQPAAGAGQPVASEVGAARFMKESKAGVEFWSRDAQTMEEVYASYTAYSSGNIMHFPGKANERDNKWSRQLAQVKRSCATKIEAMGDDEPFPGSLEPGFLMRVPIKWEMDRPTPGAMFPMPHLCAPPCMEHAPTRIFEGIMNAIMYIAHLNKTLQLLGQQTARHGGWKPVMGDKKGQKTSGVLDAKFGDHSIPRLLVKVIYDAQRPPDGHAPAASWLSGVLPEPVERAALQQICWIHQITTIGRTPLPSKADQLTFCELCKRLHWSVVMTYPLDFAGAYYLHCLSAHAGAYMLHWESLARFMQSAFEKNNKHNNLGAQHSQMGGGLGSEYVMPDGEVTRFYQTATRAILERHNRRDLWGAQGVCDLAWLRKEWQAVDVDMLWKGVLTKAHASSMAADGDGGVAGGSGAAEAQDLARKRARQQAQLTPEHGASPSTQQTQRRPRAAPPSPAWR